MASNEQAQSPTGEASTWGKFKAWGSKAAKTTGSKISKGYVKAKKATIQKMGAEETPEDPEVLKAMERLKQTKAEITELAKAVRGMYNGELTHVRHMQSFSTATSQLKVDHGDHFAQFTKQMGTAMMFLDSAQQEYLQTLNEKLVEPLEKFRDVDVEGANKLKWKLSSLKGEYDYAYYQVEKAKTKPETTPARLQELQNKCSIKKADLDELRAQFKAAVNDLERSKQGGLLTSIESFWTTYVGLCHKIHTTISSSTVKPVDRSLITDLHKQNPPSSLQDDEKAEYGVSTPARDVVPPPSGPTPVESLTGGADAYEQADEPPAAYGGDDNDQAGSLQVEDLNPFGDEMQT